MLKSLHAVLLAATLVSASAYAQVDFSFGIEIAPPAPRVEVVPPRREGFIWSPGYWSWDHGRHTWIEGRWIEARRGQVWLPERWVEYRDPRGSHWHLEPGHWEAEHHHEYDRERGRDGDRDRDRR